MPMLARVYSCAVIGLDGVVVEVEVDYGQGLPKMSIVGLPDEAVKESRERVFSAIKNAGLSYPRKPLTVNLAPASVRKEGPSFDLPIALGVLVTEELVAPEALESALVVGELSLDGTVRHVRGVLAMAALARQEGYRRLFVPAADAAEAALIPDLMQKLRERGELPLVVEIPDRHGTQRGPDFLTRYVRDAIGVKME